MQRPWHVLCHCDTAEYSTYSLCAVWKPQDCFTHEAPWQLNHTHLYNTTSFHGNIHVYNNWILASLNLCSSLVHTLGAVPFHGDMVMEWFQDFCKGWGGGEGVKNNIQTGGLGLWALEYLIVSWYFKLNDQEEELSSCLHSWELWVTMIAGALSDCTPPSTSAVGLCGSLCLMRMTRSFSRLTFDKVTITSPHHCWNRWRG